MGLIKVLELNEGKKHSVIIHESFTDTQTIQNNNKNDDGLENWSLSVLIIFL